MTDNHGPEDFFHCGTSVDDMDQAIETWKKMGAEVLMPPAEAEDVGVICAIVAYRGQVFELVAAANEEARKKLESTALRPGAIDHIAYLSADISGDLEVLQQQGGEVGLPSTLNTGFDREMAFVQMPTGLVIELMDREPKGNLPEDPLAQYHQWRSSQQNA